MSAVFSPCLIIHFDVFLRYVIFIIFCYFVTWNCYKLTVVQQRMADTAAVVYVCSVFTLSYNTF